MGVAEAAVGALVSNTIGLLKDSLSGLFRSRDNAEVDLEARLAQHMREIGSWSATIQFLDMPAPQETGKSTIMLGVRTAPRRLRRDDGGLTDERIFLQRPAHYVLLGDPGSGKTTTVKRLVRLFFEQALTDDDTLQYPIVLILREYMPSLGLLRSIASAMGIRYQEKAPEVTDSLGKKHKVGPPEAHIEDTPLREALTKILDTSRALLLLDGLDEMSDSAYGPFVLEVNQLANGLEVARIVVTCRSGSYTRALEGFTQIELSELDSDQVKAIAAIWLQDSTSFLAALSAVPYADMARRPLLLAQLLCIFNYEGELPAEPRTIYRSLLTLQLKEWDRSRGVRRRSRYSRFDAEAKLDFLAALSYELTYRARAKSFSTTQLVECYSRLARAYRLPESEAEEVASEIQTHTGIVVATGHFSFEFSHLSMQEYLCASYIVREPRAKHLPQYIREYPPPLAVAVALASEPSTWFADLILRFGTRQYFTERALQSFLSRLAIEQPRFVPSAALGQAAMLLITEFYEKSPSELREQLRSLTSAPYVVESLALGLLPYWIIRSASEPGETFELGWQHAVYDSSPGSELGQMPPSKLRLPKELLLSVLGQRARAMLWCDRWGDPGRRLTVRDGQYSYE